MKSLYVIRDKKTGAFCTSSKHRQFNTDVNSASLFDSKHNAEKAVRSMMTFLTKALNPYGGNKWALTQFKDSKEFTESFFHALKDEYLAMLESAGHLGHLVEPNRDIKDAQLDLEVVEVKLTLVG